MEIIDAQVHANQFGIDTAVGIMDALGVNGAVIDEWPWVQFRLPNGAWRHEFPKAQAFVRAHPSRFAYVGRVDPLDPEMKDIMVDMRDWPGLLALRVDRPEPEELANDRYDEFFKS
ncbi:MAG: hypothetical protein KGI75_24785, partial [Rhizobiaceae bacterium]|nr:hypothetical protein [Rhizobiaceae bacterium]